MKRPWTEWFALALLLLLGGRALLAHTLANSVALSLLRATPCAPDSFLCTPSSRPYPPLRETDSEWAKNLLARAHLAHRLAPQEPTTTLRYAEALFATGQRDQAASLLPRVNAPIRRDPTLVSIEALVPATRSRLLAPWRTEGALVAAYQFRAAGETEAALAAFRQAMALGAAYLSEGDQLAYQLLAAPASVPHETLARLRQLAQHTQAGETGLAQEQAAWLAAQGPTYRLPEPASDVGLPLSLVGYDLDESAVATGGQIEVWLWWQAPEGQEPSHPTLLNIGSFWVERQSLVNLAPNPAFAWPAEDPVVPAGYYIFHHAPSLPFRAEVRQQPGAPGDGSALHLTSEGQLVLRSFPFPLDVERPYLVAAWLRQSGTPVIVGRQCFPPTELAQKSQALRNYLRGSPEAAGNRILIASDETTPAPDWKHFATVVRAPAGTSPLCQLYLEQYTAGESLFTHLLFAKLETVLLTTD